MEDTQTCERNNVRSIGLRSRIWRRHTLRQKNGGYIRKIYTFEIDVTKGTRLEK